MTQKFYSSFSFLWCHKLRCTLTPQECGDILPLQARGFMCRQYCVLPSCSLMPCSCAKTKRMFVDAFRIKCTYKIDQASSHDKFCHCHSHLSKGKSDLKQKCTQLLTPFSGTIFHALSHGEIHFARETGTQ